MCLKLKPRSAFNDAFPCIGLRTRTSRRTLQHNQLLPGVVRCTRTYIILTAIQDYLVAALDSPDLLESIDNLQAQLSPLHGFGDGNVFDMSYQTC